MSSKYGTIVADPPWKYTQNPTEATGSGASAEHLYPTMTTEALAALPVEVLAADDAHLYMWVTNPVLLGQRPTIRGNLEAVDVVKAWGFEPKTMLTWVKSDKRGDRANQGGLGFYFRGATEHVIFATRGNGAIPAADRRANVVLSPRGAHSAKPEAFMDLVETVSPGPYLEMFSRRARLGWDTWGDQALGGDAPIGPTA